MTRLTTMIFCVSALLMGCAPITTQQHVQQCDGPEDGRFTIGARGVRLMYGYPIPRSTSHFIIRVGDHLASNYNRLGAAVRYICTERQVRHQNGQKFVEMPFQFEGVEIIQRLIPVDAQLNEIDSLQPAQYYRIEYELTNTNFQPVSVGLLVLIDNMIDDNDAPRIDADRHPVDQERAFRGEQVPSRLIIYRCGRDRSDYAGELILKQGQATPPDELVVGRWPRLHRVQWAYTPQNVSYTDAAVLLRWDPQVLPPNQQRRIAVYYGLASRRGGAPLPPVEVIYTGDQGIQVYTDTVYFETASARLPQDFRQRIRRFFSRQPAATIVGVVVEGYADARGEEHANITYSRQRAEEVAAYLHQFGVPQHRIIRKGYGERFALQTPEAQREGRVQDRKAILRIYYRP